MTAAMMNMDEFFKRIFEQQGATNYAAHNRTGGVQQRLQETPTQQPIMTVQPPQQPQEPQQPVRGAAMPSMPGYIQTETPQPRFAQPPGSDLESIFSQYAPQETGLKENLRRHNILKALGESMGAIGNMFSGGQGLQPPDQKQGAKEGLDQYQAALQDWENKKRHHELLQMQEAIRQHNTQDDRTHRAGVRQEGYQRQDDIYDKARTDKATDSQTDFERTKELEKLRHVRNQPRMETPEQPAAQGVPLYVGAMREPVTSVEQATADRMIPFIQQYLRKNSQLAKENPALHAAATAANPSATQAQLLLSQWHTVPEAIRLSGVSLPQVQMQGAPWAQGGGLPPQPHQTHAPDPAFAPPSEYTQQPGQLTPDSIYSRMPADFTGQYTLEQLQEAWPKLSEEERRVILNEMQ
jgi:hypothetical protein